MDIKDTWGVDSSPGTAMDRTHKCGNLFATMGATGSATIAAYNTDIGDRALVPAGTHPSINTGANAIPTSAHTPAATTPASIARGASMGFDSRGTVLFDSFAMMYGLAERATASDALSISFWISPDGPAQGCILGSPHMSFTQPSNPNGADRNYSIFANFNPVCGAGIASSYAPDTTNGGAPYVIDVSVPSQGSSVTALTNLADLVYNLGNTASWNYGGTAGSRNFISNIADPSYDRGSDGLYYHVMIAVHMVSGRMKGTIYINDTAIASDVFLSNDISAFDPSEPWKIPFGSVSWPGGTSPRLADGAHEDVDPMIPGSNVWHIGGRFIDMEIEWSRNNSLTMFPEGEGLYGAVTEVWIAEGQYVDWSVAANRQKFHTTDILGNVFLPTDLGAHGQTPTGTRPTMYFTGVPDKFIINRVNGATCNVYKGTTNSLTLDGRYPGAL